MSMRIVGKKIITAFAFLAISIAVISAETACDAKSGGNPDGSGGSGNPAGSANVSPDNLEGRWSGQIQTGDAKEPVYVNLYISPFKTKGNDGKYRDLKYGGRRDCTLKAEYSRTDKESRQIYTFDASPAGFCLKLSQGNLFLMKKNDKEISYEATDIGGKYVEKGTLEKE